jgi:hypothetical protein
VCGVALQNDETAKYTMKRQFDERNQRKPCDIQIGNTVLRKTDRKKNKFTPAYEPLHCIKLCAHNPEDISVHVFFLTGRCTIREEGSFS